MKKIFKYLFIVTVSTVPVMLILSGISEEPAIKTIRISKNKPLPLKFKQASDPVRQKKAVINSVEEYEALSVLGKMPDIYSGLSIDGELRTDKSGNLIISEEIRILFDFFLSARQTEGIDLCYERILEYITLTLDGKSAKKANELFSAYKSYLLITGEAENSTADNIIFNAPYKPLSILKQSLVRRIELSRNLFGEEIADQFFYNSHNKALHTLNIIEITQDHSLSDKEKESLIAEEKSLLHPSQRSRFNRGQEENSFDTVISSLREKGAVEEIYSLRKNRFGEDAATKLAALDKKKSDLNTRIEQFLIKKRELLDSAEPDNPEIEYQINEIRKNSFEEWELSALRKTEANIDRQS